MIDMLPCAAPRRVERGYIQSSVIVSAGAEIRDPGVLDQIPKDKFQIPNSREGTKLLVREVVSAGAEIRDPGVLDQIPKDKFQIPERGDEVASAGNRSRWGGK